MTSKYLTLIAALLTIPAATYLKATCDENESFRSRSVSVSQGICSWERGDGRCNIDSDCCPGRECDSFGFCQECR